MDTKKNPKAIDTTNLAFAGVSKSNIEYLMAENRKMVKKLEVLRKQIEDLYKEVQKVALA